MSVELTTNTHPGDLYVSDIGEIFRIVFIQSKPSIDIEQIATGWRVGGAVGCLNLEPYTPIDDLSKEQLLEAVKWLANDCQQKLTSLIALKLLIAELKEQLFQLKYPEIHDQLLAADEQG